MGYQSQNLYLGAPITMKIQDCVFGSDTFLFDEEGADIFALVVGDMKIDPFEGLTLEGFLLGEDRVDVV